MKRWAIGSIAFLLTLSMGFVIVESFGPPNPTFDETDKNGNPETVSNASPNVTNPIEYPVQNENTSFFVDDSRIGRRKNNRVEIRCFDSKEGMVAEIKFFSRIKSGEWILKQSFQFEKDGITGCDPEVKDFNNDGLKDLTYRSNVAARGANEVRKLFIYDKNIDELIYIKNSESYPNMLYNKKLDCIDSFMIHGSSTTVFLKINGDTLKEFASVGTGLQRIVTLTDENGGERIIRQDDMNEADVYTRYRSFDPPRP